jgi:hypothetical protein
MFSRVLFPALIEGGGRETKRGGGDCGTPLRSPCDSCRPWFAVVVPGKSIAGSTGTTKNTKDQATSFSSCGMINPRWIINPVKNI